MTDHVPQPGTGFRATIPTLKRHMPDQVTVVVMAGPHSFFGAIENYGLRVLDVLNDASSNYLQFHDATLRRGIDGPCLGQLAGATIPKTAVDFVLLEADKHEAPLRRKYALVPKERARP